MFGRRMLLHFNLHVYGASGLDSLETSGLDTLETSEIDSLETSGLDSLETSKYFVVTFYDYM